MGILVKLWLTLKLQLRVWIKLNVCYYKKNYYHQNVLPAVSLSLKTSLTFCYNRNSKKLFVFFFSCVVLRGAGYKRTWCYECVCVSPKIRNNDDDLITTSLNSLDHPFSYFSVKFKSYKYLTSSTNQKNYFIDIASSSFFFFVIFLKFFSSQPTTSTTPTHFICIYCLL